MTADAKLDRVDVQINGSTQSVVTIPSVWTWWALTICGRLIGRHDTGPIHRP